jgi:alkylation response protein AidB-like acyl-CoA dehydrogenase
VDFAFSDEQIILRDSVRKMMDRLATPDYVRRLDREQAYPDALYAAWVEMGLLRLPFAEEYGGLGGSALDMVVLADEMARKSFDFFTAYGGSVFCGLNVARKGSQEQKSYWLPKLLSGEIKMSISMSEPDAGSDLGSMRTAARRDGDEWIINGRKIWATGAGAKNNVINVYVKTDPAVDYRKGMSLILVSNHTPGLEMRKLDMLGRRCVGTYELTFDNVRVPASHLVGGENKAGRACCPACRSNGSRPPPAIAAGLKRRLSWRLAMPKTGSSSAVRSARSRQSPTCWRTCRPSLRPPGPWSGAPHGWSATTRPMPFG